MCFLLACGLRRSKKGVFHVCFKDSMNGKAMNGNVYKIQVQAGSFKGRCSRTSGIKNGKIRVLLVENEMPLAMMMVFALTRVGCDVEAVHTGKKGLALAFEQRFDLIALDAKLPDMDGFNLCSELQQRRISRKTPIIVIFPDPDPENIAESSKRGAVDYIVKPFDMTDFIYRIVLHARAKSSQDTISAKGRDYLRAGRCYG
jgi:PleD family two-component response regulator